uniref:Uncharacterized protein n=1 Tax=Astyanax mexicanus TaxID=7994 RepID=A0A8B9HMH7_ASTMX
ISFNDLIRIFHLYMIVHALCIAKIVGSSGFASFHSAGAKMVCTINLCLLFSLGS